jgi:hypothetical protein
MTVTADNVRSVTAAAKVVTKSAKQFARMGKLVKRKGNVDYDFYQKFLNTASDISDMAAGIESDVINELDWINSGAKA